MTPEQAEAIRAAAVEAGLAHALERLPAEWRAVTVALVSPALDLATRLLLEALKPHAVALTQAPGSRAVLTLERGE